MQKLTLILIILLTSPLFSAILMEASPEEGKWKIVVSIETFRLIKDLDDGADGETEVLIEADIYEDGDKIGTWSKYYEDMDMDPPYETDYHVISPTRSERKDPPQVLVEMEGWYSSLPTIEVKVRATEIEGGVPEWLKKGIAVIGSHIITKYLKIPESLRSLIEKGIENLIDFIADLVNSHDPLGSCKAKLPPNTKSVTVKTEYYEVTIARKDILLERPPPPPPPPPKPPPPAEQLFIPSNESMIKAFTITCLEKGWEAFAIDAMYGVDTLHPFSRSAEYADQMWSIILQDVTREYAPEEPAEEPVEPGRVKTIDPEVLNSLNKELTVAYVSYATYLQLADAVNLGVSSEVIETAEGYIEDARRFYEEGDYIACIENFREAFEVLVEEAYPPYNPPSLNPVLVKVKDVVTGRYVEDLKLKIKGQGFEIPVITGEEGAFATILPRGSYRLSLRLKLLWLIPFEIPVGSLELIGPTRIEIIVLTIVPSGRYFNTLVNTTIIVVVVASIIAYALRRFRGPVYR